MMYTLDYVKGICEKLSSSDSEDVAEVAGFSRIATSTLLNTLFSIQALSKLALAVSEFERKDNRCPPDVVDATLQFLSAGRVHGRRGVDLQPVWQYLHGKVHYHSHDRDLDILVRSLGLDHDEVAESFVEVAAQTRKKIVAEEDGIDQGTSRNRIDVDALIEYLVKQLQQKDDLQILETRDLQLHQMARSILHEWFLMTGSPQVWKLLVCLFSSLKSIELQYKLHPSWVKPYLMYLHTSQNLKDVVSALSAAMSDMEKVEAVWHALLDFPYWAWKAGTLIIAGEDSEAAVVYAGWLAWPHDLAERNAMKQSEDLKIYANRWVRTWSSSFS